MPAVLRQRDLPSRPRDPPRAIRDGYAKGSVKRRYRRFHALISYTAEEMLEIAPQLLGILELPVGHVAHLIEVTQQRGFDRGMLPHRQEDRRARLSKDIVRDLESSALAHRRSNVKEGLGEAELTQAVASEIYRVERQSLALLEMRSEGAIR